ncbi:MAG: hypothetical protein ABIG20_02450 [archaeon]
MTIKVGINGSGTPPCRGGWHLCMSPHSLASLAKWAKQIKGGIK